MPKTSSYSTSRSNPVLAIFVGGLLCGIGDIAFAIIYYGYMGKVKPGTMRVLQSVAAGLIGRDAAIAGGVRTAALGLLCHFIVAFCAAAAYFIVSRALKFMTSQAFICGLLYGVVVFVIMTWLVVPHTARDSPPPAITTDLIVPVVGHMLLVGLPIALAVKRFARQ